MAVRQMSETQVARWVKAMEVQGVTVTRTKKGLLLRLPNGATAMKHFTVSDIRGSKNLASELRRAGVTSPDDNKVAKLPEYITRGTIRDHSKQRVINWIKKQGAPPVVYTKDFMADHPEVDPGQCNRVFYHTGLIAEDKITRKGRPWVVPENLIPEPDTEEEQPVAEPERVLSDTEQEREITLSDPEPAPAPEPEPEPQPTPESEHVTWLDERDSWVIPIEEIIGPIHHRLIEQQLNVIRALGLNYEFRVWKE